MLDKTWELLATQGYDAVTMQEIANACELSKAALYLYFRDKESIIRELLEKAMSTLYDGLEFAMESRERGVEKLAAMGGAFIVLLKRQSEKLILIDLISRIDPTFPFSLGPTDCLSLHRVKVQELLEKAVAIGYRDGSLKEDFSAKEMAEETALLLFSVMEKFARMYSAEKNNREALIEWMIEALGSFITRRIASVASPSVPRETLALITDFS
jgi:AcrR family transcriptional regulator